MSTPDVCRVRARTSPRLERHAGRPTDAIRVRRRTRSGRRSRTPSSALVELAQKRRPIAVSQRLDERTPGRVATGSGSRPRPREPGELRVERRPRVRLRLEEDGSTQRPRLAEQRGECRPQLLGAERLVLEERELPAVERLRERVVGVREPEPDEQLARERAAKRVEPGGLARAAVSRRSGERAGSRRAVRRASRRGPALPRAAPPSRAGSRSPRRRSRQPRPADPRRPRAPRAARARSSGRPRARSPAARASSPRASGAPARRRRPHACAGPARARPASTTEMPTSGATAAYVRRSPKSERSSSA